MEPWGLSKPLKTGQDNFRPVPFNSVVQYPGSKKTLILKTLSWSPFNRLCIEMDKIDFTGLLKVKKNPNFNGYGTRALYIIITVLLL